MVYKSQTEWGWTNTFVYFCGGTASGSYIMSVISYLLLGGRIFLGGVVVSVVLVLIANALIIAHLPSATLTPKAFLNLRSPVCVGAICLLAFIVLSVLTAGIMYTGLGVSVLGIVAWIGVVASVLTMVYPGMAMGVMKAVPFWTGSSSILLVLVAGLMSGAAVTTVVGGLGKVGFNLDIVTLWLLVIYGITLLIYIFMGSQGPKAAKLSVQQLIRGKLSSPFVIGVVLLGLAIPVALYVANIWLPSVVMLQTGSILILIGGILMRYSLIASGVKISMLSDDAITAAYWTQPRGQVG